MVDLSTQEPYSLRTRRILASNGSPQLLQSLHRELCKANATELDGL